VGVLDGWRLCPRCGGELSSVDGRHLACPGCGSAYWANSKPAVQGLLVRDGRVLIGRRRTEPCKGCWDLPGGFLEESEPPLEGLRRELREETGIEVDPVEWLGAAIDRYGEVFVLSLTWIVRGEGDPVASDDIEDLQWFRPEALPTEMAFDSQADFLRRWAEREGT
jgi:ADP-ribose pyrophosphatase YjhB (NUDIX family)